MFIFRAKIAYTIKKFFEAGIVLYNPLAGRFWAFIKQWRAFDNYSFKNN
jgi:hypothetical protein